MLYRVKCIADFDTAAHRDAALSQAEARLRGAISVDESVHVTEDELPGFIVMARYLRDTDAVAIEVQLTTLVRLPGGVASVVSYHHCPHDESAAAWYSCQYASVAAYRKTRFP